MGIIRVLDDHIANQIAAGEVVERPSSVVKELVENAIDAGGTRIDVTVEEGGLQLIRISDNGSGIAPDDMETAFQRHATSKISSGKDLFQIRTLGFRGEALPSIAAVAKVECVSATDDSGLGRRLVIEGGNVKGLEDTAASKGTDIRVGELFFNTPARLKYMKTIQTELGHISDYMYRLALSHPDIAFTLKHNGNVLLLTLGNGDLQQVLAGIYGTATAKQMLPLAGESPDFRITGYISKPELTRSNRHAVSTIINGRYIRNFALVQAMLRAYHTLLPINRFPVAALHITMDPSLLDVNVHPAKLEVRFSKEQELLETLERTIKAALSWEAHIPQGMKPAAAKPAVVQEQLTLYRTPDGSVVKEAGAPAGTRDERAWAPSGTPAASIREQAAWSSPQREVPWAKESSSPEAGSPAADGSAGEGTGPAAWNGRPQEPAAARSPAAWPPPLPLDPAEGRPTAAAASRAAAEGPDAPAGGVRQTQPGGAAASPARREPGGASVAPGTADRLLQALEQEPEAAGKLPAFPQLDPIGQVHGTYIVAQNETGLYLIDQHAAHERINYEHFYDLFGRPQEASQELFVPITLEFTPSDAELLRTRLIYLEQVGVFIETFGGNSFLVRAYPHWFPRGEEKEIIEDMAEWVLSEKKSVDLSKLREKSSTLVSCKASVKANQSLSKVEMEALLDRLASCRIPYTCPHGRPIVISFSTYELEKMFKRVM